MPTRAAPWRPPCIKLRNGPANVEDACGSLLPPFLRDICPWRSLISILVSPMTKPLEQISRYQPKKARRCPDGSVIVLAVRWRFNSGMPELARRRFDDTQSKPGSLPNTSNRAARAMPAKQ